MCLSNFSSLARFFNQGLFNADQAYALDYTLSLKMEPANAGEPKQMFVFQYLNDAPTPCRAPRLGGISGQAVAPISPQNCGNNKVWAYGRCTRIHKGWIVKFINIIGKRNELYLLYFLVESLSNQPRVVFLPGIVFVFIWSDNVFCLFGFQLTTYDLAWLVWSKPAK